MTNKMFLVIEKFEKGQNGDTFLGIEIANDTYVAIKINFITERMRVSYPHLERQIAREPELLQKVNHKYVVKLVGEFNLDVLQFSNKCRKYADKYNRELKCVVTTYIEGKSFERFRSDHNYPHEDALKLGVRLIFQIGYGLAHCHKKQIAHRDLHQNNIIIRNHEIDSREAVIIDFGLGREIEPSPSGAASIMAIGTFRAPEMTNDKFKFYPSLENFASADLFSLVAIFLWWLTDGASSEMRKKRDKDHKERKYKGLTDYKDEERPKAIFNIIGQDRWDNLNKIIEDVLVDPSVEPAIEREPKTVTEWLNKLREIFPDYDPDDPPERYLEDLGNGVAIEMVKVKVPEKDIYFSKTAITIEQWQEIMKEPFPNRNFGLLARGVSFNEINEFITKLNFFTNKQYRLPTSEEIVDFDNCQDFCFANNEKLYILHLNSIGSKQINIFYKSENNKIRFEKGIYHSYRCIGSNIQFCFYISTDSVDRTIKS